MSLALTEPGLHEEDDLATATGTRGEDGDPRAEQSARVRHCHHPIKLTGRSHTIDRATGVVLSSLDSADLPDGVLYVKCGNLGPRLAHPALASTAPTCGTSCGPEQPAETRASRRRWSLTRWCSPP